MAGSDGGSDGLDGRYGTSEGIGRNRRELLDAIYGYYKRALDRLPLEEMPALAPRLLDHGVCFGFADPVTNIIANTVSSLPAEPQPGGTRKRKRKRNRKRKRKRRILEEEARRRESILSVMVAGPSEFPDLPRPVESRAIAERSLEGLITFLTCYFRYLHIKDALRYLRVANADLLVAVRLIELDRCRRRRDAFSIHSDATKIALTCAALSARQPNIDGFLTASVSLACRVHDVVSLTQPEDCHRISIADVCNLYALLRLLPCEVKKSQLPMILAASRMYNTSIEKMPIGMTKSLRSVLLDKIHAFYLKAVSRLPMHDLRMCHHRGLLKAGYCYGWFSPVSNIILNTIWYDTMFPVQQEFEVGMLCPELFVRIEYRSLEGLVAFLRSCVPTISEHDAMLYLLKSNVTVCKAISMAKQEGHDTSSWDMDSYKAVADASWHPEPDAYVKFATECLPSIQCAVKSLLKSRRTISSEVIKSLSRLLSSSRFYPAKSLCSPVELTKEASKMCSSYWEKFTSDQGLACGKIKAALHNYERSEGILYELQIVCGMNEHVGSRRGFRTYRHLFSHVNFWASANGSDSLTLFFAEFSNDVGDNDHQSICCPVLHLSTNVRCCYCELHGIRIMHPAFGSYQGSAMDFEKIALGEHTTNMDNAHIISYGELGSFTVGMIGEEYIYFDPARDAEFVQVMNKLALEDIYSCDEVDILDLRLRERECNIKDNNLEEKFMDRQKLQPDLVHSESEKERAFAYEQSTCVIDANCTLSKPSLRALYLTLEMLEKKEKVLEKKAATELERAMEFSKSKNKRAAIQSLKRKKLYESQIEQLGNFQLRIHDQMIMLEAAKATTETVDALRNGAAAMKAMQKATNIDDVDKTMEEINEQTENMKQIQEALSAPLGAAADFDEDELEAELEELEGAELESQLLEPVAAPPVHPVQVPANRQQTHPAPRKASAEEDELAALQAEMAL